MRMLDSAREFWAWPNFTQQKIPLSTSLNKKYPCQLHSTKNTPVNFTQQKIPLSTSLNKKYPCQLHSTKNTPVNFTQQKIPLSTSLNKKYPCQLHSTKNTPVNFTQQKIPLSTSLNKKYPCQLHSTKNTPVNFTQQKIPLSTSLNKKYPCQLHSTKNTPVNFTQQGGQTLSNLHVCLAFYSEKSRAFGQGLISTWDLTSLASFVYGQVLVSQSEWITWKVWPHAIWLMSEQRSDKFMNKENNLLVFEYESCCGMLNAYSYFF